MKKVIEKEVLAPCRGGLPGQAGRHDADFAGFRWWYVKGQTTTGGQNLIMED